MLIRQWTVLCLELTVLCVMCKKEVVDMFTFIRIAIGGLLFLVLRNFIVKTKRSFPNVYYWVITMLILVFIIVSVFVPVENFFITFNSPEAVLGYYNTWDNKNIELVVEGKTCDFVVASKNNSNTYLILPKTADGWKIGIGSNTRKIQQLICDGYIIYVYQYKDIQEYFLAITCTNGETLEITDSTSSTFAILTTQNNTLNIPVTSYFTSISNYNQDYTLTINNEPIVFQ